MRYDVTESARDVLIAILTTGNVGYLEEEPATEDTDGHVSLAIYGSRVRLNFRFRITRQEIFELLSDQFFIQYLGELEAEEAEHMTVSVEVKGLAKNNMNAHV